MLAISMSDIASYGNLNITRQIVVCGHPGLCVDKYYFNAEDGIYSVLVREAENDKNKPKAVEIQIVRQNTPWSDRGERIGGDICNQNHGGILIASRSMIDKLGSDFEDNQKLWNYFADGLCLKRPHKFDGWKSNSIDGNVVFVPSCEYYRAYKTTLGNGIAILCDQEPDG